MTISPRRRERSTVLLRARIRELFRHVPPALGGDPEAIHQMRVAGRRLRVALPQLARRPEGKRVRRALALLRQMTQTAGASRDVDVMIELAEAELPPPRQRSREQTSLLRRLRQARRRSRVRMVEALLDLDIARLRRYLREILARGGEPSLGVQLRLLHHQEAEGRLLQNTLAESGTAFDPEKLHRVRILARRLRYAAELDFDLSLRKSPIPEVMKALQEELGTIRDFHLGAIWFGVQARPAEGREGQAAEARRQQRHFRERSAAAHLTLLETNPVARVAAVLGVTGQRTPAA